MPTSPCYTIEQTATHCTPDDCWIVVRGDIYDVTAFLKEHPGGGGVISSLAGKDVTEEFESIGHSLKAELLMEGLKIGQLSSLPSPDQPTRAKSLPKYKQVRLRVDTGKGGKGGRGEAHTKIFAWALSGIFLCAFARWGTRTHSPSSGG